MLVALLGLGAYVYFVELPKAKQDAEKSTVLVFDPDAVDTLTLTYPEQEIRLQQTAAGEWNITAPIQAKADDTTVNNLLTSVVDEEVTRSLDPEEPVNLALYGLDTPLVRMRIALNDGTTLPQISIGKDTPVGFYAYVQKEGDSQLHLTRQAFRLGLTKAVKDLRDKTVLPFDQSTVTQIAIHTRETNIVLAKADAGWTIEQPASHTADDLAVQTYLSTLEGMRAEDFVEQPLLEMSDLGLDPAQLTISLHFGEGDMWTMSVGDEKGADAGATQRYVKRQDGETLYLVREGILKDLRKGASDFRDKTVASLPEDTVKKVVVHRQEGETFTLSRDADNKWAIDKTAEGTLKTATLSQFVTDLRELRGFEIAADNPEDLSLYGLDHPAITLTATDESGEIIATVLLGKATQTETEKLFAMQKEGSTVFTLRDYVFSRFDKSPADFWEKLDSETESDDASPITPPASADETAKAKESLE